jgi:hypothetical protein
MHQRGNGNVCVWQTTVCSSITTTESSIRHCSVNDDIDIIVYVCVCAHFTLILNNNGIIIIVSCVCSSTLCAVAKVMSVCCGRCRPSLTCVR